MAVHGCAVKRERGRRASFREQHWWSRRRSERSGGSFRGKLSRTLTDNFSIAYFSSASGDVPTLINLTDCADYRLALFRKFSWLIIRFPFANILNTSIRARDRFKFNKEYKFLYQLLIFFLRIIRYFTCLVNDLYKNFIIIFFAR